MTIRSAHGDTHGLFLIFKDKKLGVLLSLANFVKAMVFNFLVDWLRLRWIRGSFLRQILLKETIHYCCTGTNMRIQIHNRTVVYWENLTFIKMVNKSYCCLKKTLDNNLKETF